MKSRLFHPELQKSLIDIFYKTQTYACLYKAFEFDNTPQFPGVYYLSGKDPSPTQIIVSGEQETEEHKKVAHKVFCLHKYLFTTLTTHQELYTEKG